MPIDDGESVKTLPTEVSVGACCTVLCLFAVVALVEELGEIIWALTCVIIELECINTSKTGIDLVACITKLYITFNAGVVEGLFPLRA